MKTLVAIEVASNTDRHIATEVVMRYAGLVAILCRDPSHCTMKGVSDVLKELEDHADAVLRLEAEAEKHREAIRELLPKARAASSKNGPARLERIIKGVYVKDTISRWTKDVAIPRGKNAPAER